MIFSSENTEGYHDAGAGAGPDPGRVLTVSDVADLLLGCDLRKWDVLSIRAG